MDFILKILPAGALACSAGFRAFLPLFIIAFLTRGGNLDPELINPAVKPYFTGNDIVFYVLAGLAVVEVLGDKIPAVSNFLEIILMFMRPVAGGLVAFSMLTFREPNLNFIVAVALGVMLTLPFQSMKSSTRILSDRGEFGAFNTALSFTVDIESFGGAVLGLVFPQIAIILNPLMFYFTLEGFKKWRVRLIAGEELDVEFQDSMSNEGEFIEIKKLKRVGKRK